MRDEKGTTWMEKTLLCDGFQSAAFSTAAEKRKTLANNEIFPALREIIRKNSSIDYVMATF